MRGNQLACAVYLQMCRGGDRLAGLRLEQQMARLDSDEQDRLLRKLETINSQIQQLDIEQQRKREQVRQAGGARR